MRLIKMVMISACLMLNIFISSVQAKEWRGIIPLSSTCADVKRIWGVTKCETTTYYLRDANVSISFSKYPCGIKLPEVWNDPVGTVIQMTVYPKIKPKLTDLHIDESQFEKTRDLHLPDIIHYTNKEEGFSFTVAPNGEADGFMYFAATKDKYLLCSGYAPTAQPKPGEAFYDLPPFDKYGNLPFIEEKAILKNLAAELRASNSGTQGYIIAYAGKRASHGEAQARANRAKDYLVKAQGIAATRIVAIDGGYRDEAIVELWIRPLGVAAPSATNSSTQPSANH